MDCSIPDFPIPHDFPEFAQIHVHWVADAIQPYSLLPASPLAFNLSLHQGLSQIFPRFLHQFAKCWNFNISHSNKYSGLISFRVDWFYPLAVQGTPKSLPQHHSSKESIIWHSAFFMVQSSHLYMTTGKLGLTRWTFVSKVMSVFFNALCLSEVPHPHTKEQVSYNFMTEIIVHSDFGAQENKICHCFHFFPIYLQWSDGVVCHDLPYLNVEL